MSERIKQLMDQAGIDVEAVENLGEMPTAIKFAELIVQECIGIVEKNESEIHYDTGMYPAYPTATVREILEHFGVDFGVDYNPVEE